MNDTQIIEVRDVHRRYGGRGQAGFDAVRGVSFAVRKGELFALLGTNGAGKTSVLELIEGLARPSAGSVRVIGHDPCAERRLVRPRIGIMLQESGFPHGLTVIETARMWAGTLSTPRPVAEVLELVGLQDRARVSIRQLSGGEKRRLHLALAVLGDPDVLFLDEPTAGLDPESRRNTWSLVRGLLESGTTVLLTTHYLPEAEELADRLAILHRGRIVRSGSPAEVAATEPATISFRLTDGDQVRLPDLPGVVSLQRRDARALRNPRHPAGGSERGSELVIRSDDPQSTLSALLGWADSEQVLLENLDSRTASLEEAFLAAADDNQEAAA
jgi:ABC-2 type transport system ATP-binding protein